MVVTFFLSWVFPAVPWLFATPSRIWLVTTLIPFILLLFWLVLDMACMISNCGQGAIALGVLELFWIGVGLLTLISAAIASYVKGRRTHAKPKAT